MNKNIEKLERLKKEFLNAAAALLQEMQDQDVSYIENYPDYLPSFDEFVCDFSDVEFTEENN